MPDPRAHPTQSDSRAETWIERLRRLERECCHCLKCGHVQAEPNWCHLCGHRTTMPDWAKELLAEREAEIEARSKAETLIEDMQRTLADYWEPAS